MAPVPRASVSEAPVECLQTLIHMLRLPVRLRMIRHAHPQLHAGVFEEFLPKVTRGDRIVLRDDGAGEAM